MFCCRRCFCSAGQSEPREKDKSEQSSVSQRLRDNPAACHLNRFRGGGFCSQEGEQICSRGPRTVKPGVDLMGRLVLSAGTSLGDNDGGLRPSSRHHTHKRTLRSRLDNIPAAAARCSEWEPQQTSKLVTVRRFERDELTLHQRTNRAFCPD